MFKIFLLMALFCVQALAETKPQTVRLALNWKAEPQFGGFYAASVAGMDTKEGLKFDLLEGGSGTPTVQMLANQQVDFAVVSAEEILINNQRNSKNPVVGVFAVFQTNPQMIMCHSEKGFKSLSEVFSSPVTLAWQSGLTYAQYLRRKYPKIKARLVPYAGGVSTFLSDLNFCQQGFLTSEPLAAEKVGAKVNAFLVADEGFNPYTTVLAVRLETLKQSPELVGKVVRAVRGGWLAYLKNPTPANLAMNKINPAMDKDTFTKSAVAQKRLIEKDLGKVSLERWEKLAQALKDLKVLEVVSPTQAAFQNF